MKRKNLIARKKVKKKNLPITDPKILNFYRKFKSKIFNDIEDKPVSPLPLNNLIKKFSI